MLKPIGNLDYIEHDYNKNVASARTCNDDGDMHDDPACRRTFTGH
jgi:hypothetical protein